MKIKEEADILEVLQEEAELPQLKHQVVPDNHLNNTEDFNRRIIWQKE